MASRIPSCYQVWKINKNIFFFSFPNLFTLKELKQSLNQNINGLEDFKSVMKVVTTIQSINIATELQLHRIQETFAILNDHNIQVCNMYYRFQ